MHAFRIFYPRDFFIADNLAGIAEFCRRSDESLTNLAKEGDVPFSGVKPRVGKFP